MRFFWFSISRRGVRSLIVVTTIYFSELILITWK
jgi:hypothetical protein